MSVVDRSGIKPSISCGFTAMVANKHVVSTPLQVFERNWISPVYVKAHSSPWFHDPRKWNTHRSPCQWRSPPRTRLSAKRNCSCGLKAIRKTVLFPLGCLARSLSRELRRKSERQASDVVLRHFIRDSVEPHTV